jgi:hypothetical protein
VDCVALQAFIDDPVERVLKFTVKKERRQHLHQTIDRYKLDMTHVTLRQGKPQTLVCTKDRRTFEARLKEYRMELGLMGRLAQCAPQSDGASEICRKMETARDQGGV